MILNQQNEVPKAKTVKEEEQKSPEKTFEQPKNILTPRLVDDSPQMDIPMPMMDDLIMTDHIREEEPAIHFELSLENESNQEKGKVPGKNTSDETSINTVDKMFLQANQEALNSVSQSKPASSVLHKEDSNSESLSPFIKKDESSKETTPLKAASGGYLARPSNIYAESKVEVSTSKPSAEKPVLPPTVAAKEEEELLDLQMQLVERDDIPAADMPLAHQTQPPLTTAAEDPAMRDEAEEQKRRAAERLHKLRNLSFNVNAADPNNEFETVPAYIRRNMELYNSTSHIESFYSSYEVKTDQNNQTQISTINTFLDGKKPD